MKAVILAGGFGSRLSEETVLRPKPMVEIGGKPILYHIMNIYAGHGHRDFLLACGYKGEVIKEYFHNFIIHNSDYVIDFRSGTLEMLHPNRLDWRVTVVDTGLLRMAWGTLGPPIRAWFVITVPPGMPAFTVTRNETLPLAPDARSPRAKRTAPALTCPPLAEPANVTPAGSGSTITTWGTACPPLFA